MWRHFPKVWARGEPYGPISGRFCEMQIFEYIRKLLNGNLISDFVIGAQSEKVYAKDAWGMPLPNAYGYWVFISYHRCKSIGIELPLGTPDSILTVSENSVIKWGVWSRNPFADSSYSGLFLDCPLFYFNNSGKRWNRIPPSGGYSISTLPRIVEIKSKKKRLNCFLSQENKFKLFCHAASRPASQRS